MLLLLTTCNQLTLCPIATWHRPSSSHTRILSRGLHWLKAIAGCTCATACSCMP